MLRLRQFAVPLLVLSLTFLLASSEAIPANAGTVLPPVPDPLELQYMQPPVEIRPSLFGQANPASKGIFCTLHPNNSLR